MPRPVVARRLTVLDVETEPGGFVGVATAVVELGPRRAQIHRVVVGVAGRQVGARRGRRGRQASAQLRQNTVRLPGHTLISHNSLTEELTVTLYSVTVRKPDISYRIGDNQ